jgi:hypothetical protein
MSDENIIFIGRTEYKISMFDMSTRKKIFNLTYHDYSTHAERAAKMNNKPTPQTANINNINNNEATSSGETGDSIGDAYPYYHFSSSSDGTLLTVDKKTGELKWQLKLDHPIVSMYRYENEQLFKINFAIFSLEALTNLANDPNRYMLLYKEKKFLEQDSINYSQQQTGPYGTEKSDLTSFHQSGVGQMPSSNVFMSTLYIGYYKNNLYALPELVFNWQFPEITKPSGSILPLEQKTDSNQTAQAILIETSEHMNGAGSKEKEYEQQHTALIVGHHKLPEKFNPPPNYMQANKNHIVISSSNSENLASLPEIFRGYKQPSCPVNDKKSTRFKPLVNFWHKFDQLMQNKYVWSIFTVFLASLFPIGKTIYDLKKKVTQFNK